MSTVHFILRIFAFILASSSSVPGTTSNGGDDDERPHYMLRQLRTAIQHSAPAVDSLIKITHECVKLCAFSTQLLASWQQQNNNKVGFNADDDEVSVISSPSPSDRVNACTVHNFIWSHTVHNVDGDAGAMYVQ